MNTPKTGPVPKARIGKSGRNSLRLVIYFYNTKRSNDFKTTLTHKNIRTWDLAYEITVSQLTDIKRAYWNGHHVIEEGKFLEGWEK